MAKCQYRISTDSSATDNYGFAYLVIMNPSGSGKKLTLRSLEVQSHSVNIAAGTIPIDLLQCDGPLTGEDMLKCSVELDSSATIPSTVVVRRNAIATAYTNVLRSFNAGRQGGAVGNQNRLLMGTPTTIGNRKLAGSYRSPTGASSSVVEAITVRQGKAVAAVMRQTSIAAGQCINPMQVSLTLSINGKTIVYRFMATTYPGQALFSLENNGTYTVRLLNYGIVDVGTIDTPTLQIVPVGQLYAPDVNDTSKTQISVYKMDSTYPDPSASMKVYSNIGFIPYGVPEIAIAQSSAATPQGMNYLHTRDFWGPMYRNMLVEVAHMKSAGIPDTLGTSYSHRRCDLFGRKSGITLNQGEGIAIVNSAETAVGVQAAFGGWPALSFAAHVDVEPATTPYVTLTGLLTGSDIVVLQAGTSTEYTSADSYGSSTFAWPYDYAAGMFCDVCVYKAGYLPFTIRNVSMSQTGVAIPVQQVIDRAYS